jgi:ribosomal protein L20A (L18A)
MYKEYRELSRTTAVEALYSDMSARHRARFRSIHVCALPHVGEQTTNFVLDLASRRVGEERGGQETLHQATDHEEP